jgi:predicted alpha/beta-hydrolase family hydrolase
VAIVEQPADELGGLLVLLGHGDGAHRNSPESLTEIHQLSPRRAGFGTRGASEQLEETETCR